MKSPLSLSLPFACAFLGIAFAPARAQTVDLGAIVSSVRDTANHPVSGALVVATGPTSRRATTNSAGIVTLLGLPAGTYSVRVTRSAFEPYGTTAKVGSRSEGITILNIRVAADSFAEAGSWEAGATAAAFGRGDAPFVGTELTAALVADVLPVRGVAAPFAMPALALEGTRPGETRVELDGIPLAGSAASGSALRFRSALDLADVAFVEGPSLTTASLENAIGGIIDYRTPPISQTFASAFDLGYDSAFGSFQHVRASGTFGKAGMSFDAKTGDGDDSSATVKGQLTLSRATAIDVAAYEARSSLSHAGTTYLDDAPAFSASLRTTIGSATIRAREFSSDSNTTVRVGTAPDDDEQWRARGLTLDYALPFGENLVTAGYDRRSSSLRLANGDGVAQSVSTLRFVADLQLSHLTRFEIADALSTGDALPRRNDPQAALTLQTGPNLSLRFAAGSAYATAPDDLVAVAGQPFAPETSFGYRASADLATRTGGHVRAAAFEVRRFDSFAHLAGARSEGFELAYERRALPHLLGVDAGLDLVRSYAFGAEQPYLRALLDPPSTQGTQLPSDPYSKARLALTYATDSTDFRVGTTYLGANNPLSGRAVALADLSLRLRLAAIADLRVGYENIFGEIATDPEIAPLYPPREVTITLER